MQRPPDLIDRAALWRQRHRARNLAAPARFLQDDAATEIEERLALVNRRFTAPAVVTGWPEIWDNRIPEARIVGDSETLDLQQGAHDLAIHALGLHWANDPVGQMVQLRRALRPDGLMLCVLFGGRTLWELRACLAEAEADLTGGLTPRVLPMPEIRDLGGLLQRAGFALPVADSATRTVSYPGALDLMRDLRAMGEGNALAGRSRAGASRHLFLETAARYASGFGDAEGRIPATFEMIFLTGWAPDKSQPQPLRPGSATSRLADALGAVETPLPRGDRPGD